MSEAYETRMDSIALKICWISVQCYEMVLPGGKTLVTDPFYWDMSHFDGLTEDDYIAFPDELTQEGMEAILPDSMENGENQGDAGNAGVMNVME